MVKLNKINFKNIKGFIQGWYRYLRYIAVYKKHYSNIRGFSQALETQDHITEQALWRLDQVRLKSPLCLREDGCVKCGCTFPEKAFEDRACEGGCYPDMKNLKEWLQSKNSFN
jgi:hypothetical protein